ncbi:hypothetical protein GR7B_00146 [Vibrio phage vB_VcorM_GR7B]|nr:hypothetical protein GR7B_00146 [Vibrio phage vB_VcorM_GR7B]
MIYKPIGTKTRDTRDAIPTQGHSTATLRYSNISESP